MNKFRRFAFMSLAAVLLAGWFAWLVYAAPPTSGQSTMPVETQIAAPPGLTAASVKILFPDGSSKFVVLGAGLMLDTSVSPAVLMAVPQTPVNKLKHERLVQNVDGTWQLTSTPSGSVVITRNGFVMLLGLDYSINGQKIAFTPAQGSDSTDVITALY